MAYNRVNWQNKPSVSTPLNADNLNKMDKGIKDIDIEVTDARVGADGKTYASLGTSVRSQILSVVDSISDEDLINASFLDLSTSFEQGGFNNSGAEQSNNARVRSRFVHVPYKACLRIKINSPYSFRIIYYTKEKTFISQDDWVVGTTTQSVAISNENAFYIRILTRNEQAQSSALAVADIVANIEIKVTAINGFPYNGYIGVSSSGPLSSYTKTGFYALKWTDLLGRISDLPPYCQGEGTYDRAYIRNLKGNDDVVIQEFFNEKCCFKRSISFDGTVSPWCSDYNIYERTVENITTGLTFTKCGLGERGERRYDITNRVITNLIPIVKGFYNSYSVAENYKVRAIYYNKDYISKETWAASASSFVTSSNGKQNLSSDYPYVVFLIGRIDNASTITSEEVENVLTFDINVDLLTNVYGKTFNLEKPMYGLKVAILGDSISTNGNTGVDANVPEITIGESDVGVELSAYLTYYDVQAGLSLGGHTFTSAEIGTEVTFTPTQNDVGKVIGLPNNYNDNIVETWWEIAQEELGFTTIPVCWSGSSITSHEKDVDKRKCSWGWHESQIRKCGIRVEGSMNRTAPDVIIITRGINDMTHEPYTVLTDGYFDNYDWQYPTDDELANGDFGFYEGMALVIKKLRNKYKNAQIILCTYPVMKRINYEHFPTNNGINSEPQYNNAVREMANFFGCGIIEFDKCGITWENCYSEGYITDSATIPTHPSDKGHRVMGLKAITDLRKSFSRMI